MKTKLKSMFVAALTLAASTQKLGINLIRVSVLVIFVWIGSNQKNSSEIFICCLASAAPFLAWSLFTLGSLPRPLHADVCMTPIKAACCCRYP